MGNLPLNIAIFMNHNNMYSNTEDHNIKIMKLNTYETVNSNPDPNLNRNSNEYEITTTNLRFYPPK